MLKPKTLLRRLFQSYLLILLLSLIAISIFAISALKSIYFERTRSDLEDSALLVTRTLPDDITFANAPAINEFVNRTAGDLDIRVTVILRDGRVAADSDEDYLIMDNHADRPEVIDAMNGDIGSATRFSYTLGCDLVYVAIPLERNGAVVAVVRASDRLESIASVLRDKYIHVFLAALFIALAAAGLSYAVSRWINRPISELTRGARRYASGDLSYRLQSAGIEEFDMLADAMNAMARQLDNRFHTIMQQRNELEAVLSGMVEVVFAVDSGGHITEFNRAAVPFFMIDPNQVKGRRIQEVIRNTKLQRFVTTALARPETIEDEIVLHADGDRTLQAHGGRILNADGNIAGAVIVLHDITRIKRLEAVRRDFVANVSHELKTPITSIIGFVETLRDGALHDEKNGPEFLEIILRHARRLNSIIEDLLSLSRIEQDVRREGADMEQCTLRKVLESSIVVCETRAHERNIGVTLDCPDIGFRCNSALMEQAVVNLVDNAVKYSGDGGTVTVSGSREGDRVLVRVSDNGIGIPREHHERIFERFYRVDKGRSRAMGGTGLGLAIVRHIVNTHNGTITVESTPGKGSTFTISLPG